MRYSTCQQSMAKQKYIKPEVPKYELVEFFSKKNIYCLCIPVINEGNRLIKQLQSTKKFTTLVDVLILDGGSTDGSTDPKLLKKYNVRALLTKKDTGKLSAQLRMGYSYALKKGYEGIITIDGNNKDKSRDIPKFIDALSKGYDFVQGSRFIHGGYAIRTPALRYLAIRLLHAPVISLAARFWYTDTTNGFRGYSRKFLLDAAVQPFRNIFTTYELLAYLSRIAPRRGFKVIEIPVTRAYPKGETPTKIKGLGSYSSMLKILAHTLLGTYDPKN